MHIVNQSLQDSQPNRIDSTPTSLLATKWSIKKPNYLVPLLKGSHKLPISWQETDSKLLLLQKG